MAASNDDGSGLRTVTPASDEHEDSQMNAIGMLVFAGMLIIMLPVLPIIALIWLFDRLRN